RRFRSVRIDDGHAEPADHRMAEDCRQHGEGKQRHAEDQYQRRVSTGMSVTAIAAAAVSISRRWFRSLTLVGFTSSPILVAPGIRSRANSSCFAGSPGTDVNSPVTLPPGLASLF